jgi:hypothetical protein
MYLPNPEHARAALILGAALGLGYLIRLGMDHSGAMETEEKRRIGKGLILVAGAGVVYHLVSENPQWNMPQF